MLPPEDKIRDILKKVRAIEIRTRAILDATLCGAYHSVFKGQGLHFEEVREYYSGDDIRFIDWNVTARMDKTFVKIFREERELTVIVVVDVSGSGDVGSTGKTKRELAGELACILAFSALRNGDKVGLLLVSDGVEKFIAPHKGLQHLLGIVREILFFEPRSRVTHLNEALHSLHRLQKRRAIVCFISDFVENKPRDDDAFWRTLATTKKRHDLICALVSDPREELLPSIGYICLEDAETRDRRWIHTDTLKKNFETENAARLEKLHGQFRKLGVDCLDIGPGCSYVHLLRHFFEARMKWKR